MAIDLSLQSEENCDVLIVLKFLIIVFLKA